MDKMQNIYFLGIGGIGMSALVRYFLSEGKVVAGYDRTPSPLTDKLIEELPEFHLPAPSISDGLTIVAFSPSAMPRHTSIMAQSCAIRTRAPYTDESPWGWYLPSTSPTVRADFL